MEERGISTHAAFSIATICAVVVAIYMGNSQASLIAQNFAPECSAVLCSAPQPGCRYGTPKKNEMGCQINCGELICDRPVCGNGKCEKGEDQILCPSCAIGPDGQPFGDCRCRMSCEPDCKDIGGGQDGGTLGNIGGHSCPDIECGNLPDNCTYTDKAFSNGCLVHCDAIACEETCVTVDCAAPPEGCRYVDARFEGQCQVNCGRLECEEPCATVICNPPPDGCEYINPKFDRECQISCGELKCRDKCESMDCEFGCKNGQCLPNCKPYECRNAAGQQPQRCTADGQPINYFRNPCESLQGNDDDDNPPPPDKPSAPKLCEGKYKPGESFVAADGCNKCICSNNGLAACTKMACVPETLCEGKYKPGESFPSGDGCNTCFCSEDGHVGCTEMWCGDPPEPQPPHPNSYDPHDPDSGCYSSQDCGPGTVCSVDFGDCQSGPCGPDGNCADVCTGFCMLKEFAYPETLPQCDTSAQCEGGRVCTKEVALDCMEECPLSKDICMVMCTGRCIIPDIDGGHDDGWKDGQHNDHDDVWDQCGHVICAGPNGIYEVAGCDAAGYPVEDPCGNAGTDGSWGDYDYDQGITPDDVEYEDEVRIAEEESRFSDTDLQTLEGKAANKLAGVGIIGGFADGTFGGGKAVNRAETAKFIVKAVLGDVPEARNNGRFSDALEGEWYIKYIIAAANYGFIKGYPDGSFKPGNTVNTAELSEMLVNAFRLEKDLPHNYGDVPDGSWFGRNAGAVQKYDLFPGRPPGQMQPGRLLTRGEVAIAIYRLLDQL